MSICYEIEYVTKDVINDSNRRLDFDLDGHVCFKWVFLVK